SRYRRTRLYEAKYPETKAGKAQAAGMNRALGYANVSEIISPTFATDTAKKTGFTNRSIQQDIQIATQLAPHFRHFEIRTASDPFPYGFYGTIANRPFHRRFQFLADLLGDFFRITHAGEIHHNISDRPTTDGEVDRLRATPPARHHGRRSN